MDVQVTPPKGRVEIISGCMFSGKTQELINRAKRAEIAGKNVVGLKPEIDNRYQENEICSHEGYSIDAITVDSTGSDITKIINTIRGSRNESYINADSEQPNINIGNADVFAIDEVNFFNENIIELVNRLTEENNRVILSGLDLTFRGEPFSPVPELLAIADHVEKRRAVCEVCGSPATRTQRLIDGEPAPYNSPTIDVGGDEKYEPRCHKCHEVPRGK